MVSVMVEERHFQNKIQETKHARDTGILQSTGYLQ